MKRLLPFATAALLAVSAAPALAAPTTVTATDPQSVVDALKELGYVGKIDKMDSGRTSIAVTFQGLKAFIDFYDCAKDLTDCYTLLFTVGLDLENGTTLEKANDWNSDKISGRVWLNRDRDPTLDFSVTTFKGISYETFQEDVSLWDGMLGDLKDFFDF